MRDRETGGQARGIYFDEISRGAGKAKRSEKGSLNKCSLFVLLVAQFHPGGHRR